MAIITLITDFGTSDGYVGAMKGVITRLAGSPAPSIAVRDGRADKRLGLPRGTSVPMPTDPAASPGPYR